MTRGQVHRGRAASGVGALEQRVIAVAACGLADGQGRPEYSYLVYKLLGDGPVVGARMPPDGPSLSAEEIARVSDWIAAGAPDN